MKISTKIILLLIGYFVIGGLILGGIVFFDAMYSYKELETSKEKTINTIFLILGAILVILCLP